jgi:hypothetical protein
MKRLLKSKLLIGLWFCAAVLVGSARQAGAGVTPFPIPLLSVLVCSVCTPGCPVSYCPAPPRVAGVGADPANALAHAGAGVVIPPAASRAARRILVARP